MATPSDALTIDAFGRQLRAGTLTSEAVTAECLRRIDADNPRLNAFILATHEDALHQAREADRELAAGRDRGPLHGVPISIKDLLDVKATPTTAASNVRAGHMATHDAAAVANLRRAGALFVGKTNLHEFAFGTTSEESAFGVVRNPHDRSRSAGGSSGGSAVSVAAGMAMATVGTDTGGSIRIPAAACGIVGLKPTCGEVSTDGVVPLSRILDHVGPLARSVGDAWTVYRGLLGAEPKPVGAVPADGLRLAVLRSYFCDLLDDDVRTRFENALDRLARAGVRITETEIPHAPDIASVYLTLVLADAAAYHAATLETVPEKYTPGVRLRLEMGRYILGEDYVRALNGREQLKREVDAALASCDALVLPALPIPAPPIGAVSLKIGGVEESVRNLMLRETQLFNLTTHPAVAMPCGQTAEGWPCSLQLVGARLHTEELVRVALTCERELDSLNR